jgi:hypothetical protein
MMNNASLDNHPRRAVYVIQVRGELDRDWQQWFNGFEVAPTAAGVEPVTTTLFGPVADQAALRGILCKLWDLNLTLISLRRMDIESEQE